MLFKVGSDMRLSRRCNTWVALGLVGYLALAPVVAEENDAATDPSSFLKGRDFAGDGKNPVAGATVMLYHLSTEYAVSETTGSKGDFEIRFQLYGYFDLAVAADDGVYVANQVINLPPSGKSVVVLRLRRFAETTPSGERRPFPGTDELPIGVAMLVEKLRGAAFWGSPRGLSVIGGAGAGLLLLLSGGGSTVSDPMPTQ